MYFTNPIAKTIYPPSKILFEDLHKLIKNHTNDKIRIIDCFNSLEKEDFVDLLHLNMKGAKKITNIIESDLNKYSDNTIPNPGL